jgi:hypothetical protein
MDLLEDLLDGWEDGGDGDGDFDGEDGEGSRRRQVRRPTRLLYLYLDRDLQRNQGKSLAEFTLPNPWALFAKTAILVCFLCGIVSYVWFEDFSASMIVWSLAWGVPIAAAISGGILIAEVREFFDRVCSEARAWL